MFECLSQPREYDLRVIADSDPAGAAYRGRVVADYGVDFPPRPPERHYLGLAAGRETPGIALPEQGDLEQT
eukprot:7971959-Alexandrium_andersonii.AAC.1